jgi:hypothetical protein
MDAYRGSGVPGSRVDWLRGCCCLGAGAVGLEDFDRAILRAVAGIEKKRSILVGAEKEVVAKHEAGHAIVSTAVRIVIPATSAAVEKLSIIPRTGGALGCARSPWLSSSEEPHSPGIFTVSRLRLCVVRMRQRSGPGVWQGCHPRSCACCAPKNAQIQPICKISRPHFMLTVPPESAQNQPPWKVSTVCASGMLGPGDCTGYVCVLAPGQLYVHLAAHRVPVMYTPGCVGLLPKQAISARSQVHVHPAAQRGPRADVRHRDPRPDGDAHGRPRGRGAHLHAGAAMLPPPPCAAPAKSCSTCTHSASWYALLCPAAGHCPHPCEVSWSDTAAEAAGSGCPVG